jgi:hypothetical protein
LAKLPRPVLASATTLNTDSKPLNVSPLARTSTRVPAWKASRRPNLIAVHVCVSGENDSRLFGLFRCDVCRSQIGRCLRLTMGLDQEIDCTTQAPYAVANRELIDVLIIRDGDSNMNFFCFWPTLNAKRQVPDCLTCQAAAADILFERSLRARYEARCA